MAKSTDPDRDRVFQVSTNRDGAQHKLRYVEASLSADQLNDCRICRGALASQPAPPAPSETKLVAGEGDVSII